MHPKNLGARSGADHPLAVVRDGAVDPRRESLWAGPNQPGADYPVGPIEAPQRVVLDMNSTEISTYGQHENSAYNGHFESNSYHPLLLFNGAGDCLAAKLPSGNVQARKLRLYFVRRMIHLSGRLPISTPSPDRGVSQENVAAQADPCASRRRQPMGEQHPKAPIASRLSSQTLYQDNTHVRRRSGVRPGIITCFRSMPRSDQSPYCSPFPRRPG